MNGTTGVPLAPRQQHHDRVLAGVSLESVTGLWDGRYFSAVMAETNLGRWVRQ
jgi:hypothetical protein